MTTSQVFETLSKLLDIDEYCWTSDTRNIYTKVPFDEFEGDYSDLTFKDKTGTFAQYLVRHGGRAASAIGNQEPTYHVEVKTTKSSLTEPFNLSQNQLSMVCNHLSGHD